MKRSESGVILDPVTLGPDAPVARAKEVMSLQNISGVPIVGDNGKLVGIISRANLVRALATTSTAPAIVADADDRSIREQLLNELRGSGMQSGDPPLRLYADGNSARCQTGQQSRCG